jgi:hypothetical protein
MNTEEKSDAPAKVICHAEGDKCHGCAHYRNPAKHPLCEYAPANEATASDTPRTDAKSGFIMGGHRYLLDSFAKKLERELNEARIPICVGRAIIGHLAKDGQWVSENGSGLIAADELFRKDPYDELSTLRREKAELREALKTLKHYTSSGYDVFEPPMGSSRKPTKTTTGKFIDAILAATKEKEEGK